MDIGIHVIGTAAFEKKPIGRPNVIYCQVKQAYGIIWIYVDWDPAMGFSDLGYEKELHYKFANSICDLSGYSAAW